MEGCRYGIKRALHFDSDAMDRLSIKGYRCRVLLSIHPLLKILIIFLHIITMQRSLSKEKYFLSVALKQQVVSSWFSKAAFMDLWKKRWNAFTFFTSKLWTLKWWAKKSDDLGKSQRSSSSLMIMMTFTKNKWNFLCLCRTYCSCNCNRIAMPFMVVPLLLLKIKVCLLSRWA